MASPAIKRNETTHPLRGNFFTLLQKQELLLGILLAIATIALYYPVHRYPWDRLNADDEVYVTNNLHVLSGLNWSTITWAFRSHTTNWHPLTWLSHALDCQMFGVNPAAHHEINVLFHALNAMLLFWVLRRATGFTGRSFVVAALFALHPVNVEAVAWVAERKTMLSTLFFLLALAAYRWYARERRPGRYAVVALLFALGLMAKPQVITLPFVLLLWDYWPLQRMFAAGSESSTGTPPTIFPAKGFFSLVEEKLPLFGLAAMNAVITMYAQGVAGAEAWPYTFSSRLGNAIVSYARYLGMAFYPASLAVHYPHPGASLKGWQIFGALALLLGITVLVAVRHRQRYLVVGWLWFLGTLVPMIGLVQVGVTAMADRYAYIAFIGLFIMVCWGVAEWWDQRSLPASGLDCVSLAVLVLLATVTHRQISYWKDAVALWSHTLQVTGPNNWAAEYYLGDALRKDGDATQAAQHLYKALALSPSEADTNLGVALYEHQQGNLLQAIDHYKKVMTLAKPGDLRIRVQVLINMGHAYRDLGDSARAQKCFDEAVGLQAR